MDVENKRVFHLRNHPWNARLHDGDELEMWFNAKTWRKIRGLRGEIEFSGRIVSGPNNTNETSSESSVSYMSSATVDNGLNCQNDFNNVTCGSSLTIISTSPVTVEFDIPVNFGTADEDIRLYAMGNVLWMTADTSNGVSCS